MVHAIEHERHRILRPIGGAISAGTGRQNSGSEWLRVTIVDVALSSDNNNRTWKERVMGKEIT